MSYMNSERNHFIDILKGICIVFVIVTHFPWEAEERLKYLFPFWIGMAVPIFMIISGYVNTLSFERKGISKIGDAYQSRLIISKVLRYTIPFALVFLAEIIVLFFEGRLSVSAKSIFAIAKWFLIGGKGPGSYYYPILIQFIFLFPIIHFIVKKFHFKGVILCGLINGAYEVLQYAYGMNEECYRLLVFRYCLLIAAGCYSANMIKGQNKKTATLSFFAGAVFLFLICYLGYEPKIVIYMTRTSFLAALYIIPVVLFLIGRFPNVKCKPLEVIGKSSYDIFLVQMAWYYLFSGKLETIVERPVHLLINVIVCICAGLLLHVIETPITNASIEKSTRLSDWIDRKMISE